MTSSHGVLTLDAIATVSLRLAPGQGHRVGVKVIDCRLAGLTRSVWHRERGRSLDADATTDFQQCICFIYMYMFMYMSTYTCTYMYMYMYVLVHTHSYTL